MKKHAPSWPNSELTAKCKAKISAIQKDPAYPHTPRLLLMETDLWATAYYGPAITEISIVPCVSRLLQERAENPCLKRVFGKLPLAKFTGLRSTPLGINLWWARVVVDHCGVSGQELRRWTDAVGGTASAKSMGPAGADESRRQSEAGGQESGGGVEPAWDPGALLRSAFNAVVFSANAPQYLHDWSAVLKRTVEHPQHHVIFFNAWGYAFNNSNSFLTPQVIYEFGKACNTWPKGALPGERRRAIVQLATEMERMGLVR